MLSYHFPLCKASKNSFRKLCRLTLCDSVVPLGCSLFGISGNVAMKLVGVGFIISAIQDSMETALNSYSDVLFTATAEFLDWKKQGRRLPL